MPTLAEDFPHLVALQAVDTRLDRARAEQTGLDTGATLAASYNTGKAEFDALRATALKAQGEQRDAELQLQTIENKAQSVSDKMYGGTVLSARELVDLQRELEMLGRQKNDVEEKTLNAMESASEALTQAQTAERALLALADRYKKVRATFKERHAALTVEIAAIEKERAVAAVPITPAFLTRYDTIRARRGGIGVAVLSPDGSCGACHTKASSGIVSEARALKSPQTCEYCGRLLAPAVD